MSTRGRGPAGETTRLINVMVEITESIRPCSVRALAYRLFVGKFIPSMEKPRVAKVSRLSVIAREAGLLPWEWIVDPTRQQQGVSTWDNPQEYAHAVQRSYRRNKWDAQRKHVSVWSEKATVEGTLKPVLDKYEVPFQVLHGWSGATPVMDAAQANLYREQNTLILYCGDWDPSGLGMSELDLPHRLARYSTDNPSFKDFSVEAANDCLAQVKLEIRRIALTPRHLDLLGNASRFAAKTKQKDPRYRWFTERYGHWCWELDALSPVVLRACVENAILAELDHESWDRYVCAEQLEFNQIVETCSTWTSFLDLDQKYSGVSQGGSA